MFEWLKSRQIDFHAGSEVAVRFVVESSTRSVNKFFEAIAERTDEFDTMKDERSFQTLIIQEFIALWMFRLFNAIHDHGYPEKYKTQFYNHILREVTFKISTEYLHVDKRNPKEEVDRLMQLRKEIPRVCYKRLGEYLKKNTALNTAFDGAVLASQESLVGSFAINVSEIFEENKSIVRSTAQHSCVAFIVSEKESKIFETLVKETDLSRNAP